MKDTNDEMQKYFESLILSKTPEERFMMGLEMMEDGRQLMITGINKENQEISEKQLKILLLKRQYKYDKSLFWLNYIDLW